MKNSGRMRGDFFAGGVSALAFFIGVAALGPTSADASSMHPPAAHAGSASAVQDAPIDPGATGARADASEGAERSQAVDRLFAPWDRADSPGAAVLVMLDDEVVHLAGYGSAELEHGVPIGPSTVFDAASVAKQFTGLAVAMLVEEGLVSPDDDVRRHIPELSKLGEALTLRHLVHHTSGLRDWPGTLALAGWDLSDVLSFDHILEMAFRQTDLNFPPGEDYAYSNTGYNLLAEVVTRVTGRPFHRWVEEEIFQPLGMHDTRFHHDHRELIPRRARSYVPTRGRFIEIPSHLTAVGSSSLMTTVEDMGRWLRNFEDAAVGGRAAIERMHEVGALNDGARVDYGWGLTVERYRGTPVVGHGGSWAGYRASVVRFPEHGLGVAVLGNVGTLNPHLLVRRIADIYLGGRLDSPGSDRAAGREVGGGGTVPTLAGAGWWPDDAELAPYEGEYRSPELDARYRIVAHQGRLIARHARTGSQWLEPVSPDRFQGGWFGTVRFVRDDDGEVEGFTATSHRVRNLRFERVPSRAF